MDRDNDQFEAPELPSTEKGPRSPEDQEYTGTGESRSSSESARAEGGIDNRGVNADVDPAIIVGATTSSHPAEPNGLEINRSGSGGTGGPSTDEADPPGGNGA